MIKQEEVVEYTIVQNLKEHSQLKKARGGKGWSRRNFVSATPLVERVI